MILKRIFNRLIFGFIIFTICFIIACFIMFKLGMFNVRHIDVEGNKQFSAVELSNHVLSDERCKYAPYIVLKYKFFKPKAMPFVSDLNASMTSLNSVKLSVVEKPVMAYVEYLDSHLFIDTDGIVVESSDRKIDGIVKIEGISCKNYKLYERLDVQNPQIINHLGSISKELNKYKLMPDAVVVNKRGEIDLRFKAITVNLGDVDNIEAKIARVSAILPKLKGKKGVLKLNNYRKMGDGIVYRG